MLLSFSAGVDSEDCRDAAFNCPAVPDWHAQKDLVDDLQGELAKKTWRIALKYSSHDEHV